MTYRTLGSMRSLCIVTASTPAISAVGENPDADGFVPANASPRQFDGEAERFLAAGSYVVKHSGIRAAPVSGEIAGSPRLDGRESSMSASPIAPKSCRFVHRQDRGAPSPRNGGRSGFLHSDSRPSAAELRRREAVCRSPAAFGELASRQREPIPDLAANPRGCASASPPLRRPVDANGCRIARFRLRRGHSKAIRIATARVATELPFWEVRTAFAPITN